MKCNLRCINLVRILSVWTHLKLKTIAQAFMIIGDLELEQAQSLSKGGNKKTFLLINLLFDQRFDRRNAKLFTSDLSKTKKTAGQTVCIFVTMY